MYSLYYLSDLCETFSDHPLTEDAEERKCHAATNQLTSVQLNQST